MAAVCEHGAECHDGTESSAASAPEGSRAWLLIEHPGPWPREAAEAAQPAPLAALVESAEEFGLRVQMIRRPGRRQVGDVRTVFVGWTAGPEPFLRRGAVSATKPELAERDLKELAAGITPPFGSPAGEPVFLVCTHAKRSACCARFGAPLAQALAARHPGQVWESTHVGGHRFAANLVILPHGLYYGPVGLDAAAAAIDAYRRGAVAVGRYRGRAGQPRAVQEAEYARLVDGGALPLSLPAERDAGRVPHLERPGDLGRVEDSDRDGEGQGDRVAQVDQRVQPRQAALLAEPAQQRLGRAAACWKYITLSPSGSRGPGRRPRPRCRPRPAAWAPGRRARPR